MPKKKVLNKKKKVTVLDASNVQSVLTQMKDLEFPIKSSLKIMGRVCVAEGLTIQEAITNLRPEVARGVGILTLEKGEVKKEKVINSRIINGLYGKFVSRVGRELALKHILMFFDKSLFEN
mgnify:CR=1 FL=1